MWKIIICQICGKKCNGQLGRHLRIHDLNIKEYEKIYGPSRDPNLIKKSQKSGSLGGGYRKGHFQKKEERILSYLKTPDLCKECGDILTYEQHLVKYSFCSHSCCAIYNNARRSTPTSETIEKIKIGVNKYLEKNQQPPHTKVFLNICEICNKEFYWGRKKKSCSEKCRRRLLSKSNLKRTYQGFSHSRKIYYKDVVLGSPHELKFAELLDDLGVIWSRPKYLSYTLTDKKNRKYYPDFLLENGVYIDTKNSFLQKKDRNKLTAASKQNEIVILVFGLEGINEDNIKRILMNDFSLIQKHNQYF